MCPLYRSSERHCAQDAVIAYLVLLPCPHCPSKLDAGFLRAAIVKAIILQPYGVFLELDSTLTLTILLIGGALTDVQGILRRPGIDIWNGILVKVLLSAEQAVTL